MSLKSNNILNVLSAFLFFIQPAISDTKRLNFSVDGTLHTSFQSNSRKTSKTPASSGSFVWDSRLKSSLSLRLSDNLNFSNKLDLGYGQINIRSSNSKSWSKPTINSDFINFNSILRYDNNQNNYSFIQMKYSSSFFDHINDLNFNPYTLCASAGAAYDYSAEDLMLTISGSTALSYAVTKNRVIHNESDTGSILQNRNSFELNRYITGSIGVSADVSYTISKHLYINSNFKLSQPFKSTDKKEQSIWNSTDLAVAVTLNAPVTSFLNFCYSANFVFNNSRRKTYQFDQSLSAGFYFNLKSPA